MDEDYAHYDFQEKSDINRLTANLWRYAAPTLLIFGSIGNCLAFGILQTKSFRKGSLGLALSFLTLVDASLQWTVLFRQWILHLDTNPAVDIRNLSEVGCKTHIFAANYFTHLSAWTVAVLSVERAVTFVRPFASRLTMSGRRRIGAALVTVALLLAVSDLHFFWTVKFVSSDDYGLPGLNQSTSAAETPFLDRPQHAKNISCVPTNTTNNILPTPQSDDRDFKLENQKLYIDSWKNASFPLPTLSLPMKTSFQTPPGIDPNLSTNSFTPEICDNQETNKEPFYYCTFGMEYCNNVWHAIDISLSVAVPFFLITVSNVAVVVSIWRAKNLAIDETLLRVQSSPPSTLTRGKFLTVASVRKPMVNSATVMLLAVSLTFLVTTTPLAVHLCGSCYWIRRYGALPEVFDRIDLAKCISSLIYYTGSCLNFILYCVSGSRFRRAALEAFQESWRQTCVATNSLCRHKRTAQKRIRAVSVLLTEYTMSSFRGATLVRRPDAIDLTDETLRHFEQARQATTPVTELKF